MKRLISDYARVVIVTRVVSMATVRPRRTCRIDGSDFYHGMLQKDCTKKSSSTLLNVGEPDEELPDDVYAVNRVVSSRQHSSIGFVKRHNTRVLSIPWSCLPLRVRK